MVHNSCCVVNCKNTGRNRDCKFYTFPTASWKLGKRKKWIKAVRRKNVDGSLWTPKPTDTICSDHFVGGKKSEEEASPSYIPTLFPTIYKKPKVNEKSAIKFRRTRFLNRRITKQNIRASRVINNVEVSSENNVTDHMIDSITDRTENSDKDCQVDFISYSNESDMDEQQCLQATQPLTVTNVAVENLNQVIEAHTKEDPEANDIDIGPTVFMDSQYRTGQINIKQEDETDNEDDARGLCNVENDEVLCRQVKVEYTEDEVNEFAEDEDKDIEKQQYLQAMQPPIVTNTTADNLNQVNEVHIKEESEDNDIDIGPTVLQHMDSQYRTGQTNIKKENEIHNEDDERGLCKVKNDQVLCSQDNVEFTEDSQKEPDHSQFRCDKCYKVLKSKKNLVMHHRQVHATEWVRCGVCNKEFKGQIYLTMHIRKVHNDQIYECDVCNKILKTKHTLQEHVLSHQIDSLRVNKCDKCLKTYARKETLMRHYKQVHGKDSYTCNKCYKEFKCEGYLLCHMRSVHGRQQFECDICKKTYKTKKILRGHILSLHRLKPEDSQHSNHRCKKCLKTYSYKGALKTHYKQKHKIDLYICAECDREFKCKSSLLKHLHNTHSKQEYEECGLCSKMCKSRQALYNHILLNHREKSEGQSFTCDYCQKIYSKKILLQQHIKCVHVGLIHQCLKCDKYFKCRPYLQQHEKFIHRKVQKFQL